MSRYGFIKYAVVVTVISLVAAGSGMAEKMARVNVSGDAFSPRDYIAFDVDVAGNPDSETDLYFAILAPGCPSPFFLTSQHTVVTSPVPYTSAWRSGSRLQERVVDYTFTDGDLEGIYYWCGLMVNAGGSIYDPADYVGEVDMVPFTFSKNASGTGGLTDWAPREGTVYRTTRPEFFARFSKPVNSQSVEQNVEIGITSLSSGKNATVRWENGERWVQVDLPGLGTVYQKLEEGMFIAPSWGENNTLIKYAVGSYTAFGQTFALNPGVSYQYTFRLKEGASFADGQMIPAVEIGPVTFSVAD